MPETHVQPTAPPAGVLTPGPDDPPPPAAGAAAAVEPAGPLGHIPIFSRLDAAEQAALLGCMRRERAEAQQTIFWVGDRGDALYLIDRGSVAVTVPNDAGEHVSIAHLGPGGFFGEISLLDGGRRTATVRANEPTELLVLHRRDFHDFLSAQPGAALDILRFMGERLRESTEARRHLPNANVVFERSRVTPWQFVSDLIARVAASQWFTLFHIAWFGSWLALNLLGSLVLFGSPRAPDGQGPWWLFDPFPFGLLTMVVSLEAIFLSIFVMVSQNRQTEKDRLRTDLDYQVNVKAHAEIMEMTKRLEHIESSLAKIAENRVG
ncbi:MAG: DUF1003 domain-containing protein [Phycisphaerales bacterium]|nr:DUF1003 domain-containing protein [Phycisphaerales bacterium]